MVARGSPRRSRWTRIDGGRGSPGAGEAFSVGLRPTLAAYNAPRTTHRGFRGMERQEPTIGKPDMQDMHFRPRSHRGMRTNRDSGSGLWLKAGLAVAVLVLIVMGLIEWNARRQAAAMKAELMRPMTPRRLASTSRCGDGSGSLRLKRRKTWPSFSGT